MNTGKVTYLFRKLGWMHGIDLVKFYFQKIRNYSRNKKFLIQQPHVPLPPDYMMFESFQLNYRKYVEGGKESAEWIINKVKKYKELTEINILDWGCGPARITRHLPEKVGPHSNVFGTDYNAGTIEWCIANIGGVDFSLNHISPPLAYQNDQFDLVIGISVFTHFSLQNHMEWIKELHRIINKAGILFITTHGNAFKVKLTESEKEKFEHHELIIRDQVKEGHRVFAAFHSPQFMNNLISDYFDVLEHCEGKMVEWGIEQDYWILIKK